MRSFLLDATLLVDVLRDVPEAVSFVRKNGEASVVSAHARALVLSALTDETARNRARALLDELPCLPVTRGVADRAADLRRSHGWSLPTSFEAAMALENSLTLVTRNTADFADGTPSFVAVPTQDERSGTG